MRPIATDVVWSVCLCLLVTTVSPTKLAEPVEVSFGVRTPWDQGTTYLMGAQLPSVKREFRGSHLPAYCTVQGKHSYSVGGSSDAAFRCQYCSNLFTLWPLQSICAALETVTAKLCLR